VLSALILKPQVAFLVPFALLVSGYWRVVLAWLAVSVPLAIVTLLATGTAVFHHISQSLHAVSGVPGPIQSSLLRQLPLPMAIIGIVLVLAASALILWRGRGSGPSHRRRPDQQHPDQPLRQLLRPLGAGARRLVDPSLEPAALAEGRDPRNVRAPLRRAHLAACHAALPVRMAGLSGNAGNAGPESTGGGSY
jgi:hypothetical protein